MARQLRIEFPRGVVMARVNRREPIFLCEQDRELFLATLGEACSRTGWRVHARVMMTNHITGFSIRRRPISSGSWAGFKTPVRVDSITGTGCGAISSEGATRQTW
jgi:hypothetical protein